MSLLRRRTFLERLGLGAGATILSPMISRLVREAQGAQTVQKRFITISFFNGSFWPK